MDANKCMKYVKILAASIMLVISVVMIVNIHFKKASFNLSRIIDSEEMDDLILTIYYTDAFLLTSVPLNVDYLISIADKIIVDGCDLKEYIDLFKQINGSHYQPAVLKTDMDIRVYYVLESKKNGKLFDVAMWGSYNWLSELFDAATGYRFDVSIFNNDTVYVNGIEVRDNAVFYRAILPFFPEDEIEAEIMKKILQQMGNG